MELRLKFRGIDDWNRPIFRGNNGKYYGSVNTLFSYSAGAEEVIKHFKESGERVVYMGSTFGCEPMGSRLKEEVTVKFEK